MITGILSAIERRKAEDERRRQDLIRFNQLDPHIQESILKQDPTLGQYLQGGPRSPLGKFFMGGSQKSTFQARAHTPEEAAQEAKAASEQRMIPFTEQAT